jgi:hypothetical protein
MVGQTKLSNPSVNSAHLNSYINICFSLKDRRSFVKSGITHSSYEGLINNGLNKPQSSSSKQIN